MDARTIGAEFEDKCRDVLLRLGFDKVDIKRSADQGADLIALANATRYVFQCKCHKKKQGNGAVQEAIGAKTFYNASRCGVISSSSFTKPANHLAKPNFCLLFTLADLTTAADQGQKFSDLVTDYQFPDLSPVAQDFDVVKVYERTKLTLGHTPKRADFDPATRHRIDHSGGLNSLIRTLGDRPHRSKPSDDEMKAEYKRVRSLPEFRAKTPTLEEMRRNSRLPKNCFHDYPWTKLQKECGDRPNIERGVSKEKLLAACKDLRTTLGRWPTLKELDENGAYRWSYYRRRWGTTEKFLMEAGIPTSAFLQRRYRKQELAIIYLLLKKLLEIKEGVSDFPVTKTILENLRLRGKVLIRPATLFGRGGRKQFLEYIRRERISQMKRRLDEIIAGMVADLTDDNE